MDKTSQVKNLEFTEDASFMQVKVSNPRFLKSLELLLSQRLSGDLRIVELGCGEGELLMTLAIALNAKEMHGVDIDEEKLAKAQSKGIKIAKADLNVARLPYPDDFFDVVVMEEVIEHLVNPDNAIREAYRILKPGGYFLISTPNLAWWINRLILMLGYQPYWMECSTEYNVGKFKRAYDEPLSGHLRLYTFKALKELLNLYGFKIISCKGVSYGNVPSLFRWIDRLLSKSVSLAQILIVLAQK